MEFIVSIHGFIKVQDKFLVVRRSLSSNYRAGYWDFPGGKLKFGETPEEALIREISEEMNVVAKINGILNLFTLNDNNSTQHFQAVYKCDIDSSKILLNKREHDDIKWLTLLNCQDLPMMEYVVETIQKISAKILL